MFNKRLERIKCKAERNWKNWEKQRNRVCVRNQNERMPFDSIFYTTEYKQTRSRLRFWVFSMHADDFGQAHSFANRARKYTAISKWVSELAHLPPSIIQCIPSWLALFVSMIELVAALTAIVTWLACIHFISVSACSAAWLWLASKFSHNIFQHTSR